jgi:hypothetical protein
MYSVAPGGGLTTTGLGDNSGAATIEIVGAATVGETEGFAVAV